ncbi:MAG: MFS transporter [Chloroflexi bacterium]|nr:MFS transporter [Chloroflexota bacterium]MCI0576505.1 MFS transporter [Chloroflexota bacterium]MCI0650227.1 MFS transporter [Chloroflexota bacterium]MCI0729405.1 MFS transporter [Chloroflexota bacterium]
MTPQRIVRDYLAISGLYTLAASLIWGVNTLFLLEAGLDIFGVFVANAAFTAGMAIFEIPTGVVADTLGRRVSYLLSLAVLFLSTLGYLAVAAGGGDLLLFCLVSVFLGLGFTFYSGAVEAWLVDALQHTGYQDKLDPVFARAAIVSGAAMLIGTTGGGFLGNVTLSLPYLVRSALLALLFIYAFRTMHDIGYQPKALVMREIPNALKTVARGGWQHGWKQRPVRLLMLFTAVQGIFSVWAFYAWQPYILNLLGQPDAVWVAGVIAALVSLAVIAGNTLADRLARFCTRRTTLLLGAAAVQTVALAAVGLSNSFWPALLSFLLSMAAYGVIEPVGRAFLHQLIPSAERATIISFGSMLANVGSIAGQVGLGRLSQTVSIASAYVASGVINGVGLLFPALLRRSALPEDLIVGAAGARSSCAAQGLPAESGIDTDVVPA